MLRAFVLVTAGFVGGASHEEFAGGDEVECEFLGLFREDLSDVVAEFGLVIGEWSEWGFGGRARGWRGGGEWLGASG
jgi:hypothetical protein